MHIQLSQAVYNHDLMSSSLAHSVSLGRPQMILEYTYICGPLDAQECARAFQSPLWI